MPRRETRKAAILGDLLRLSVTMEANKEELADLEPFRLKLTGIVTETLEVGQEQAALQASKQASSKKLRRLLTEGMSVANVLRKGVSHHYGPGEEKVAEFGVQPFRGRKVKAATKNPASTTPPAAVDSAAPVTSDQ